MPTCKDTAGCRCSGASNMGQARRRCTAAAAQRGTSVQAVAGTVEQLQQLHMVALAMAVLVAEHLLAAAAEEAWEAAAGFRIVGAAVEAVEAVERWVSCREGKMVQAAEVAAMLVLALAAMPAVLVWARSEGAPTRVQAALTAALQPLVQAQGQLQLQAQALLPITRATAAGEAGQIDMKSTGAAMAELLLLLLVTIAMSVAGAGGTARRRAATATARTTAPLPAWVLAAAVAMAAAVEAMAEAAAVAGKASLTSSGASGDGRLARPLHRQRMMTTDASGDAATTLSFRQPSPIAECASLTNAYVMLYGCLRKFSQIRFFQWNVSARSPQYTNLH